MLQKKLWSLKISLGHCPLLQTPGLGGARVSYTWTCRRSEPLAAGSCPQPSTGLHTHKVLYSEASKKQDCFLSPPSHSHGLSNRSPTSYSYSPTPLNPQPLFLQSWSTGFQSLTSHKPAPSKPHRARMKQEGLLVTTDREELESGPLRLKS